MAKYKHYDYAQEVLLPVSLEQQLVPGTLEFAIHTLVETRMDMSVFDAQYNNDDTGRAAYDPKVLLKVVPFAYSRGMISSRKILKGKQKGQSRSGPALSPQKQIMILLHGCAGNG